MKKYLMLGVCSALLFPLSAEIRTGDFNHFGSPPDANTVAQTRKRGTKCPDAGKWPRWWYTAGSGGEISFPGGGVSGRYAKFSGRGLYLVGYHGMKLSGDFVLEFYARGTNSALYAGFYCFERTADGKVRGTGGANAAKGVAIDLNNDQWERYRFRISKPERLYNVHPFFQSLRGTVDLDNTKIYRNSEAMLLLADVEAELRRKKMIPKLHNTFAIDEQMKKQVAQFSSLLQRFRNFKPAESGKKAHAEILKTAEQLYPYLATEGLPSIKGQNAVDMIILSSAMQKIMDGKFQAPVGISVPSAAEKVPADKKNSAVDLKKNAVTVSSVKPGKLLYNENDKGSVHYVLKNTSGKTITGELTVKLGFDIEKERILSKTSVTLPPGDTRRFLTFDVGPEMYGREVSVSFTSSDKKITATGKEYFQAAREFMRVMMHGTSRYQNLYHYFAHEPTDFGVQIPTVKKYLSGQPRYNLDYTLRRNLVKHRKNRLFAKQSFYQCRSFCGGMGFEEIRQNPDYILYGSNGQPEVDPIYGGLPNPFELAAPVERDPERRAKLLNGQKFLDVDISGWHHVCADFTNPEVIRYGTKCIVDFMKWLELDSIYLDDVPSVQPGYNWKGVYNTAGKSKEELAEMNTEISRLWHTELRRLKPDIGSWCNGVTPSACRYYRALGMWERTMGMGVDIEQGKDVNDDFVRDLASYKNTIFLAEVQYCFVPTYDSHVRYPESWLKQLLEQRDFMIQKHGGSVVFGYLLVPQPPANDESNGYWPTLSYFHAITLATQHHHILYGPTAEIGMPSQQPFDQFMTRYSALLWGRDVKTIPGDTDSLKVGTGKENILYKDFVYSRKNEQGEDRIIHLVRKYPLKKWDYNWSVPASALNNLKFSMKIPEGKKIASVKCMRPYLADEPQYIVEVKPEFTKKNGILEFQLPPMYYYQMIVVRLENK